LDGGVISRVLFWPVLQLVRRLLSTTGCPVGLSVCSHRRSPIAIRVANSRPPARLGGIGDEELGRFRVNRSLNSLNSILRLAVSLWSIVGLHACARPSVTPHHPDDISAAPAADYLVDAFDRFPLVAFSEPRHGAGGTREFLTSLVRHARFAGTVNDIVVEFGNARYQDIADRYIAGEPVTHEQLKQIWENTTVVTGVWTAPMYEGMLSEIRALNRTLPLSKRVRVVLGDPPIDWSVVRGPADEDMNDWRDAHFAWVVEEQVIKRGHRALLWIGGAHIGRQVRFPDSLIHILDRRFPNQTMVALSLDRGDVDRHVLDRLGEWQSLTAAPVSGTWLGRQDFRSLGGHLSTGTVEQNMDAAVFWEFPSSRPDEGPRVDARSPMGLELRRRQQLSEATIPFRGGKIRFKTETTTLTTESEPALQVVLGELQRDTDLKLLVKAFADRREANGIQLSMERAQLVVDWLVTRGVRRERLEPLGCGSSRALWVGHTEQERAANRKAELVRISKHAGCEPPASFDFP
jgi:outer membrane protein OmpA-like peptidoglycan-associated protein